MKINTIVDTVNIETVKEAISGVFEESDSVYYFNNGSIDHINNDRLYRKETFNYFTIYNKSIYNILNKIKSMLKQMSLSNEINIDRGMYYIESEYFNNIDTLFWYDSGGDKPLCFSGYVVLDANEECFISIDNETFNISAGTIILMQSSSKIIWHGEVSGINFNIAPISMLDGQYKQKWIPMI